MKVRPWTTAAAVALLLGGALAAPAEANTPSTAQSASLGTTYFGNTTRTCTSSANCNIDFWRLPNLRAQDEVTIAWRAEHGYMCLTADVDDYDYAQNLCNFAEYVMRDPAGRRDVFIADYATANAYVNFYGTPGMFETGPYQFVVETIRSKIGVAIPAKSTVRRDSAVTLKPTFTDGTALPDGVSFTMKITFKDLDKTIVRTARTAGGKVRLRLRLGKGFAGHKGRFIATRRSDTIYQGVRSPTQTITVK
ncbi:hypothetical protein [Nocardioides sp.]|uniref:hypothetical protein n=1 Tax=Nocardioides sp. TaxID=35761 RepID=UPI0026395932|nr:hypothetical protein [Nocardioides sp.]MCW2735717.1 hypothetical protein [Nocardioides sp.]